MTGITPISVSPGSGTASGSDVLSEMGIFLVATLLGSYLAMAWAIWAATAASFLAFSLSVLIRSLATAVEDLSDKSWRSSSLSSFSLGIFPEGIKALMNWLRTTWTSLTATWSGLLSSSWLIKHFRKNTEQHILDLRNDPLVKFQQWRVSSSDKASIYSSDFSGLRLMCCDKKAMELEARLKKIRLCLLNDIAIHKTLVEDPRFLIPIREFFLDAEDNYDDTISRLQSLVNEYVSLMHDIEQMKEYEQTLDNTFSNLILVAPFARGLTKSMNFLYNATRPIPKETHEHSQW